MWWKYKAYTTECCGIGIYIQLYDGETPDQYIYFVCPKCNCKVRVCAESEIAERVDGA